MDPAPTTRLRLVRTGKGAAEEVKIKGGVDNVVDNLSRALEEIGLAVDSSKLGALR